MKSQPMGNVVLQDLTSRLSRASCDKLKEITDQEKLLETT